LSICHRRPRLLGLITCLGWACLPIGHHSCAWYTDLVRSSYTWDIVPQRVICLVSYPAVTYRSPLGSSHIPRISNGSCPWYTGLQSLIHRDQGYHPIINPYIQSESMNAELGTEVDEECRCSTQSTSLPRQGLSSAIPSVISSLVKELPTMGLPGPMIEPDS
jgi:hypothetical protein